MLACLNQCHSPYSYVIAVYQQPDSFSAPEGFTQANMGISAFDFEDYLTNSKLGALVGVR